MAWVPGYWREPAKKTAARQAAKHEQLWNEIAHAQCVKALESSLAEMLPDYGRDDLDRLRETY